MVNIRDMMGVEPVKKIAIIRYVRWGGCFSDACHRWEGQDVSNRDSIDFGSKEYVKKSCTDEGYDWVVVRHHKGSSLVTPREASRSFSLDELNGLYGNFKFTKGIVV